MFECMSEEEIQYTILECCTTAENKEAAEEIKVVFNDEEVDPPNSGLSGRQFHPVPVIFLNESRWKEVSAQERTDAIRKETCWLLACMKMGREVKVDGFEYRHYAFKVGLIKTRSPNEKAEVEPLINEW